MMFSTLKLHWLTRPIILTALEGSTEAIKTIPDL